MNIHQQNKQLIKKFRDALYDCDVLALKSQLRDLFAADCKIHLAFPFEDLDGADGLFEEAYVPLLTAVPDLERRDSIVMAGASNGANWVGCSGHYVGVMKRPFLDIPPTQHAIFMRYTEFFRIEDDQIVEMQAIWDIPQLMMQAKAWPLAPSLGVEWFVPGPATQDGIITAPYDKVQAAASLRIVLD
ncbi:MAG: ester cyclase, partial [Chloroflexi bacterium]|nr:ester cyclase [Chloroflexota bacterium]